MDDQSKDVPARQSWCKLMAWVSLLVPPATVAIYAVRGPLVNPDPREFAWAIFLNAMGFICGVASAIQWRQHRQKYTIWIAGLGILASGGVGFIGLLGCAIANSMGRNC